MAQTATKISCLIGAVAAALFLTAASATTPPASAMTIGVGDNGPGMFKDRNYKNLKTKISRKIVPWDFYKYEWDRKNLDEWMAGAKKLRIQPMVAFNHSEKDRYKLPSVSQYKYALRYLLRRYPQVKTFTPWNEANHVSQPTWNKPRMAAQYFNISQQICKGCKIVAADVLDQKNMITWLKSFQLFAKSPKIWGLHSYVDANRNRPWAKSSTKLLLDNVKGEVWLTEVGGLVAFKDDFPYDEIRARDATKRTLLLAGKSKRIKRVYLYSWYGTDHGEDPVAPFKWDSGLMTAGGSPRPAFYVLRNWLHKQRAMR